MILATIAAWVGVVRQIWFRICGSQYCGASVVQGCPGTLRDYCHARWQIWKLFLAMGSHSIFFSFFSQVINDRTFSRQFIDLRLDSRNGEIILRPDDGAIWPRRCTLLSILKIRGSPTKQLEGLRISQFWVLDNSCNKIMSCGGRCYCAWSQISCSLLAVMLLLLLLATLGRRGQMNT